MSSLLLSSGGVLDMIARLTVFLLAAIAQRAMDEPKLWLMQTKVNTFWDSIHIAVCGTWFGRPRLSINHNLSSSLQHPF